MSTDFNVGGFQFRHGPTRKRARTVRGKEDGIRLLKQSGDDVEGVIRKKDVSPDTVSSTISEKLNTIDFSTVFLHSSELSGSPKGVSCLRDILKRLASHVKDHVLTSIDFSNVHPMANDFFHQILLELIGNDAILAQYEDKLSISLPIMKQFKNPSNVANFEKKHALLLKKEYYEKGLAAIEDFQRTYSEEQSVGSSMESFSPIGAKSPDSVGYEKLETAKLQLSEVINIIEDISDVGRSISTLCDVASDRIQSASRMIRERTFNIDNRPTNTKRLLTKPKEAPIELIQMQNKRLLLHDHPGGTTSAALDKAPAYERNIDEVPEETPMIIRKITSKRHV